MLQLYHVTFSSFWLYATRYLCRFYDFKFFNRFNKFFIDTLEVKKLTALYITIPLAMVLAVFALGVFLLSLKNGQYEDIEGPKYRILFDEEFDKKNKHG